ncbi:MAG: hypothetical protein WC702_04785 [Patescibacteria group bacterium]|jgi:hypothetical protein
MRKTIKTNLAPPPRPARAEHSPVVWVSIVVVIVALAFAVGWAWNKFKVEPVEVPPTEEVVVEETTKPEPTIVTDPNTLTIEWTEVGDQKKRETDSGWNNIVFGGQELLPEDGVGPKAFGLGTVKGGTYDGYELQSYIGGISGLGVTYRNFYLLVAPTGEIVVLDKYASEVSSSFTAPVRQATASSFLGEEGLASLGLNNQEAPSPGAQVIILDTGAKIAELETDKAKDKDGQSYSLIGVWQRVDYPNEISFSDSETEVELENGNVLSLYNGSDFDIPFANELFYYVRQDGRTVWYNLDLGLWTDNNETTGIQGDLTSSVTGVPTITWSDGTVNSASYFGGKMGGCGTTAGLNVVDVDSDEFDLVEAGLTANGEKVYEPKSYEGDYYTSSFEGWRAWPQEGETHETLEQFAAAHPFFYVQDSLGRWIEFKNSSILPMAECGKPVIYLYPETTTDLDVALYPQGGFTYTEPVYKNGWRVTASPDGTLINRDDGEDYPYLFWEGRGGIYVSPNRYWVVKQSGVHDFLVSTLARLGLNTKETTDFIEFWEPRMQSAAYYKIGFYGTSVMNQLAPLSISETPDTLIRILMDYEPLDAPIKANPPALPTTPERDGFTVVEWGGVLR